MCTHRLATSSGANLDRMLLRCGLLDARRPTAPLIAYADVDGVDARPRRASPCSRSTTRRARKRFILRHSRRRKSFSARARRQRRQELSALDALPIVRRARAGGLHGAALRAYVSAVATLDGLQALHE